MALLVVLQVREDTNFWGNIATGYVFHQKRKSPYLLRDYIRNLANKILLKMALKALFFDLDQTLIDSNIAQTYRKNEQWDKVYSLIPSFKVYEGMDDLLKYVKSQNLKICIISSFLNAYCQKVLSYWNLPHDEMICFEDISNASADKNPIHLALEKLSLRSDEAVAFGDMDTDIDLINQAGVYSVGCLWGSNNHIALLKANHDLLVLNPTEIKGLLSNGSILKK